MIKRLRNLRPVRAAGEGPSNLPNAPPPPHPRPLQRPPATVQRPPVAVQRPAATAPPRQRPEALTNVPLRGFRAPLPNANRPVV